MQPRAIAPDPASVSLLPHTNFMDAFAVTTGETDIDAPRAAHRMLDQPPSWMSALLRLRDTLVAPFGLQSTNDLRHRSGARIGFFPVLSQTPQRVVLGLDDSHLDFRVLIDVRPTADAMREITLTTLVETHNLLGRVYIRLIYPFHTLISRHLLTKIARPSDEN